MIKNTKELPCINAITLDYLAICKAYFAHAPATKKRGGLSAWQMLYKSQSSTLSIAYDTGQFFLVYIYTPDGSLPYNGEIISVYIG